MHPKVSILMPAYNSQDFINEAIESVLAQTFQNWELFVCDDSSTDKTRKCIYEYASTDNRIRLLNNEFEKGASGARNTCLKHATGSYVAFLDSDDKWLPSKLESQLRFMCQEDVQFCYTDYLVIDENGNVLNTINTPKRLTKGHMLVSNFIPCLTAMYDARFFGKVEQPNIKKRNDYALWLKMFYTERLARYECLPVPLACYRQNNYGLSSNKIDALRYHCRCLHRFAGVPKVYIPFLVFFYCIVVLTKKKMPRVYNLLVKLI